MKKNLFALRHTETKKIEKKRYASEAMALCSIYTKFKMNKERNFQWSQNFLEGYRDIEVVEIEEKIVSSKNVFEVMQKRLEIDALKELRK